MKSKITKIHIPKTGYNIRATVPIGLVTDCHLTKGDLFHWQDSQGSISCGLTLEETPTTSILQETPNGQFFIEVPRFYKKRMTQGLTILWTWENEGFQGTVKKT